ncbi:glycosyltransferase involved in cell wall biosynthesis [Actinocrispum wychmicini]|uniref:Glycosyltransferase involved in cell wall biosynthesis n=1 Tax=Actinocrispum wychmicini TaxID=1213861 RepID=A0A4R2JKE7_9PSEU|nr:glycosyltransferase involved in cell wall biosynthesis [Actinocrispum wychmicini]
MILLAIMCAVVAACCFAGSVTLQHGAVRAQNEGRLSLRTLWRAMRSPRWLAGTALGITGSGLHATALSLAPLVVVQPIGVLSLVLTVVLGRRVKAGFSLLAVVLGVAGFVGVAALSGAGAAGVPRPELVQPFVVVAALIFVLGRRRCLGSAAAAAVLFGTGSALIRVASLDIFTHHQVLTGLGWAAESVALIVAGGWAVHQAYAAGQAATVIAVTTVVDPLTAVVIGLWCYGEAARLTPLAYVALVALAVTAGSGVLALARTFVPLEDFPMTDARLRILMAADTFPPDINGAAHFAGRLANGLAAHGHDVHVVCPSYSGRQHTEKVGAVTVHRLKAWRTPFHPTFRVTTPRHAARAVAPLIQRLRPDVVHVQSHFSVGRSVLAASGDLPVIATNHFMPENLLGFAPLPRWARDRLSRWAWRDLVRVFRNATTVTTPTPRAVELLTAQGLHQRALAISCGVDLTHYATERTPNGDRVTVLFVGRLDKEKNVGDLLRALPFLPSARAEIVGDGSCREELSRLAKTLHVEDRVHFHGFVSDEDLVSAYRAADVFCMPGTAELQSIATMEAMAASLPVVAADAMALPHLVRGGVSGFLYPPGDVNGLAAAVATLAADPSLRADMGKAGHEIVSRHSLDETITSYEELYTTGILSRATSSTTTTTATASTTSNEMSTTSWVAPAWSGDAPPSRTPTNAPGNVTSPTVRV